MTIGKKMMLSEGAMLLTLAVLAGSSLYSINGLDNQLDDMGNKTAKKSDLIGAISMHASEMLSFERGVLVRVSMKDMPKAEGYHNSFSEQTRLLQEQMNVLRPLIVSEQGRKAVDVLSAGIATWLPGHQELWEAA